MNGYGTESMTYGVPTTTWNSWDARTRELWLQDYNRTEEQATYYSEDKSWYWDEAQAFNQYTTDAYEGIIDRGESVYDDFKEGLDWGADFADKALVYGIGLGALYLLLK